MLLCWTYQYGDFNGIVNCYSIKYKLMIYNTYLEKYYEE